VLQQSFTSFNQQAPDIYTPGTHVDDSVYAGVAWTADCSDGVTGRDGEGVGCTEGEGVEVFEGSWGKR
jgi:hypothetical protein